MPTTLVKKLASGKPKNWPGIGSFGLRAIRCQSDALLAKVEHEAADVRIIWMWSQCLALPVTEPPCVTIGPTPPALVTASASMPADEMQ